jgi:patatin-related protein
MTADGQQAPLTKESVSERLAGLTADDVALAGEPIEDADWAYIEAAAALSSFDPDTLKPLRDVGSDSLGELLARSTITDGAAGELRWRLTDEVRRDALARISGRGGREAILRAYEQNAEQADDELQEAFLAQLRGESKPFEKQERAELAATLQVVQWLHGIVDGVPDPAVVRRELDRAVLFEPFRFLVGEHFRGRKDELRRLSNYVGVRPTVSKSEAARRGVRSLLGLRERPPLLILGVGGVGKSTLIAKFILDHAEYVRRDAIAFVYLDFDRSTIAAEDPSSLLIEAAQQLGYQDEKTARHWEDLRLRWLGRVSADPPRARRRNLIPGDSAPRPFPAADVDAQQEMFDAFAKAYAGSFRQAPLLLVLDTFEEVQYRSRDFADALWEFLEDLQRRIPTLRTVIAGRAPVDSFATDDLELRKLDEEAGTGLLQARGVEDVELARLTAARVGGNPLALWLAAALLKQAFADDPALRSLAPEELLDRLEIERDVSLQALYTRILRHVHDPDIRKLAHPGLVLRRVTSELIRDVLAEPCEVDVPDDEAADRLFETMAREISLVRRAKDGSLEHRRDVRRLMLPALDSEWPESVAEIHRRAVEYYAGRDDPVSRAEEIYHRLARGDDPDEVERDCWMDGVQDHLGDAIPELPERARVHLAALLKVELDEPASVHVSQLDRERQLEARVERLLQLGRVEGALAAVRAVEERLPGSRLYYLEALAQWQLGMVDEPLQTIDIALRSMPSPPTTSTAVELLSLAAELETRRGDDGRAAEHLHAAYRIAETLGEPVLRLGLGLSRLQAARRAGADAEVVDAHAGELRDEVVATADEQLRANPELARELSSELGGMYPEVLERVARALRLESSFESGLRELRLSLVCSGGLALAVYTHGITKEIARLVLGSALREAGIDPSRTSPSAEVYSDLLYELEQATGVRTRVVVDIVSGTSASGINGLVLAKALSHNLSLASMRDFWLVESETLRAKHGLSAWLASVRELWRESLEALRQQVGWSARERHALEDPRTRALARMLFAVLQAMDDGGNTHPSLASLMPERHPLDVSIPVTDVNGYDRTFQIASPRTIHGRRHAQTFDFRFESGRRDDFGAAGNGALAFAALTMLASREEDGPISFDAFHSCVPEAHVGDLQAQVARTYALGEESAENARFIDGGLLQTTPMEWVADTTKRRRSDFEVDRRVLYVASRDADRRPGPEVASLSTLAREESIASELTAVRAHNERVQRIKDVIESSFATVAQLVESIVGRTIPEDPSHLRDVSRAIAKRAAAAAGLGYAGYVRLRIGGAVDRYARTFCNVCDFPEESNHGELVRSVLRAWAEERGLFAQGAYPNEAQREFLNELDLGYRERRLLLVRAGLAWWHRDLRIGQPDVPPRAELDRAKTLLYDAVEHVRRTMGGDDFGDELRDRVWLCFPEDEVRDFRRQYGFDAVRYLERHRGELEAAAQEQRAYIRSRLDGFDERVYGDLKALTETWSPNRRGSVFVRYLGFPLWDALLYPIQAFGYVGENDFITLQRLSPADAYVLSTPPAEKLGARASDGISERAGRQSEYLWGRLDGAAQLIAIVLGGDHPSYRAWCLRACAAILDEDGAALSDISATLRSVRAELGAM